MDIAKMFETEYRKYLTGEFAPMASKELVSARDSFQAALENYLRAVEEFEWACGYGYAVQQMKGGSNEN
ncbi:MAG: hypothetical protein PUE91_09975 [Clostridiales bacterium]|nr:hypothetical protein [Clostridiales bacterium]